MRRTVFFAFLAIVMMMTVGTGCTEKKAAQNDTLSSDSLLADTSEAEDSMETIISEEPMPKAADELFDDFFFNFAANRRLQRERIDFPLTVNSYGKMPLSQLNVGRLSISSCTRVTILSCSTMQDSSTS